MAFWVVLFLKNVEWWITNVARNASNPRLNTMTCKQNRKQTNHLTDISDLWCNDTDRTETEAEKLDTGPNGLGLCLGLCVVCTVPHITIYPNSIGLGLCHGHCQCEDTIRHTPYTYKHIFQHLKRQVSTIARRHYTKESNNTLTVLHHMLTY